MEAEKNKRRQVSGTRGARDGDSNKERSQVQGQRPAKPGKPERSVGPGMANDLQEGRPTVESEDDSRATD